MSRNNVKFGDLQVGDTVDFEPKSKSVKDSPASGTVVELSDAFVTVNVMAHGTNTSVVERIRRPSLVLERRIRMGGRYHWVFQ